MSCASCPCCSQACVATACQLGGQRWALWVRRYQQARLGQGQRVNRWEARVKQKPMEGPRAFKREARLKLRAASLPPPGRKPAATRCMSSVRPPLSTP